MPPKTRADGWTVTVTHPDTDREIPVEVLDDPQLKPSLGGEAEIRIPTRKNPDWLTADFTQADANAALSVALDGEAQPIDELETIEQEADRTILVGRGGVELDTRVQAEFDAERRHIAAEELITDNTAYAADVDAPDAVATETLVQDPDTTAELDAVVIRDLTDAVAVADSETRPARGAWPINSAALSRSGTALQQNDNFTDGEAERIDDTGESLSGEFTVEHTIPADRVGIAVRFTTAASFDGQANGSGPGLELSLNGATWQPVSDNAGVGTVDWRDLGQDTVGGEETYPGGDLTPGTYTVEITGTSAGDGQDIDHVAPYDTAYYNPDNWDNTLHEPGGHLDDPRLYPLVNIPFDDYESAFSVVGARAEATLTDTGVSQRLQVSNDQGGTYLPDDGSEDNTASVDVTFPATGATARVRVRLGAYSPDGARDDATPRVGYEPQALDSYALYADIEQELLLINETIDASLSEALNQIAVDELDQWSYRLDGGTPTVAWTQIGSRVADDTPELGATPTLEKAGRTYQSITVKGSPGVASSEPVDASQTPQALVNDEILTGSETLYDPDTGENFVEGQDYTVDYSDGAVTALSGTSLTLGETYRIDYRYKIRGTYTAPTATNPDERVVEIPGVTSDRQAEQIAFVLVNDLDTPRYAATVTLPRVTRTFDPLEALPLEQTALPAAGTPLEIRDPPAIAPTGIALRLGSRRRLEAALAPLREQVRRVSERS